MNILPSRWTCYILFLRCVEKDCSSYYAKQLKKVETAKSLGTDRRNLKAMRPSMSHTCLMWNYCQGIKYQFDRDFLLILNRSCSNSGYIQLN